MNNRDHANETVLESSPVARYVLELVTDDDPEWTGTAAELLAAVEGDASDKEKSLKSWPRSPRAMAGAIRRLAPNIRAAGVDVELGREPGGNRRRLISLRKDTQSTVPIVPTVPNGPDTAAGATSERDGMGRSGTDETPHRPDVNPDMATSGTVRDGWDDKKQSYSKTPPDDYDEV